MLIEFRLTVEVDPKGDRDELTEYQEEGLDLFSDNLEKVLETCGLKATESYWREI